MSVLASEPLMPEASPNDKLFCLFFCLFFVVSLFPGRRQLSRHTVGRALLENFVILTPSPPFFVEFRLLAEL